MSNPDLKVQCIVTGKLVYDTPFTLTGNNINRDDWYEMDSDTYRVN